MLVCALGFSLRIEMVFVNRRWPQGGRESGGGQVIATSASGTGQRQLPTLPQDTTSLPFQALPHDALREGLVTLKDDARHVHPVDQIQTGLRTTVEDDRMATLSNLYGSGLPARMQIERQILSR